MGFGMTRDAKILGILRQVFGKWRVARLVIAFCIRREGTYHRRGAFKRYKLKSAGRE